MTFKQKKSQASTKPGIHSEVSSYLNNFREHNLNYLFETRLSSNEQYNTIFENKNDLVAIKKVISFA